MGKCLSSSWHDSSDSRWAEVEGKWQVKGQSVQDAASGSHVSHVRFGDTSLGSYSETTSKPRF